MRSLSAAPNATLEPRRSRGDLFGAIREEPDTTRVARRGAVGPRRSRSRFHSCWQALMFGRSRIQRARATGRCPDRARCQQVLAALGCPGEDFITFLLACSSPDARGLRVLTRPGARRRRRSASNRERLGEGVARRSMPSTRGTGSKMIFRSSGWRRGSRHGDRANRLRRCPASGRGVGDVVASSAAAPRRERIGPGERWSSS